MRSLSRINSADYLHSVGYDSLVNDLLLGGINPMSLIGSTGKSGSFFFFSCDNSYLIKAIPKREYKSLKNMLRGYYNHIKENRSSLLTRFYGLHKLTFFKGKNKKKVLYICVMNNILLNCAQPEWIYDLKGSSYKRKKEKNESSKSPLKDNNFLINKDYIRLESAAKNKIERILLSDTNFLSKFKLIDYSLLLVKLKDPNSLNEAGQKQSSTKSVLSLRVSKTDHKSPFSLKANGQSYRIGIIDFLTNFTIKKRAEFSIKRLLCGKGVSCVPPSQYSIRFVNFLNSNVFKESINSKPFPNSKSSNNQILKKNLFNNK